MKHKVRLLIEMDMEVSDEYLAKLKKHLLFEICKHCFKNNSKTIINESIEVLEFTRPMGNLVDEDQINTYNQIVNKENA